MKKYLTMLSMLALFCLAGRGLVWGEIPKTINYQGSLQNKADGTPVNGTVPMSFALYDHLTNGNLLWSDTMNVSVSNGIYSVVLGSTSGNPLDLPFDKPYFLEVSAGDPPLAMAPRQPLTSVPYAQRAAQVDNIEMSEVSSRKIIHIPLPGSSKFQVGELTDGYKTSLTLQGGTLKLEGGATATYYPTISMGDGTQRALYFYGLKGSKVMRLILDNGHSFEVISPALAFDTGNARIQATSSGGVMQLKLKYGTAMTLAGYYGDIGMYMQGANGRVGMGGNTNPQYALDITGQVRADNVSVTSDRRWKEEIATLDGSLGRVSQLRGVSFRWKDTSRGEGPEIGVIAQEVEAVFPEVVSTDSEGYKSVSYEKLVAPLIEAVKTLNAENEELKRRLDALEAIVNRNE